MGNVIKTIEHSNNKTARIIISDKNWLETTAVEQLKKTLELPGMCCGIGMPDLHPGKGQPIGAAFVSNGIVYPHLVGSDIGCGMGLWQLEQPAHKINLSRWEKKLSQLNDDTPFNEQAFVEALSCEDSDDWWQFANERMGTIGGGNHFAEIQKVETVYDSTLFESLNLKKSAAVLLVHSGSRGLGQWILRQHVDQYGAKGLLANEPEGLEYLRKHNFAIQWAECNRRAIAHRMMTQLSVEGERVLDITHNNVVSMEEDEAKLMMPYHESTKDNWIHRKGATPTDKGMVMIPGSRGTLSYLVKPLVENSEVMAKAGFSLAHGAGRKWKRSECKGRLRPRFHANQLTTTELGSKVICKDRELLYEEAPQAYKKIDRVIDDLLEAGLIKLVAAFRPIITYKTTKA
ncbi:RNA ligase RtcB family protein [Pleionea sp. CnH1-48]|uniref:RNA ligase RtcB family protein n=1 Tax=Pleionea sp. CnH1-48 TaxID=2954494 RepID=UPI002097EDB3|nr:RNA ligase RtcB family protein [Pleionea sp. CnH1-48]MCO7223623.1 RNA ligase RtcB family protein [Pleionea sp. CnH1-48]